MPHPTDLRGYPPRFFELVERVAKGETIHFRFAHTEQGRRDCYRLAMKLMAFRKLLRQQSPENLPEHVIAAAWEMELIKQPQNKYEFWLRPQRDFSEAIDAALNNELIIPPGDAK